MIYDALLGTSCPDYVASFGNSDVYNAADWVKIIDERDETVLQAVIQSSVTVNQHHLIGGGRWGGGRVAPSAYQLLLKYIALILSLTFFALL